jgi:REP element-mobilizing transposase RayT
LPRRELPDGLYHVAGRAVAGALLFRDADDYKTVLLILLEVVDRFDWTVHALCFMGTHYHLVVETTRNQLSTGMKRLNERYARAYNERYGRHGHVFGDRFAARVIESESHYREACRYVVLNPVAAGLCSDATDWPWAWCEFGVENAVDDVRTPASA